MSIPSSVPLPVEPVSVGRPVSWTRRILVIVLVVIGLFAFTYALAWYNSFRLGGEFFNDAEAAYGEGRYLDALIGSEEVDVEANTRVQRGGYYQAYKLWGSRYANPKPEFILTARQRIAEIVQSRLDISQAETFIQMYTGRNHPLYPDVYYRLGQLYEAEGDRPSAIDIYRDCAELFPNRPDITQAAKDKLAELGVDS